MPPLRVRRLLRVNPDSSRELRDLRKALGPVEYAEVTRMARLLLSLDERSMAAWEANDYWLAERLDMEYAELAEKLEAYLSEAMEGDVTTDLEPGEFTLLPAPHGVVVEGPEGDFDPVAALASLYAEYLAADESPTSRFYGTVGSERDDLLADIAHHVLEDASGQRIDATPRQLMEAAEDAYGRRRELLARYRRR